MFDINKIPAVNPGNIVATSAMIDALKPEFEKEFVKDSVLPNDYFNKLHEEVVSDTENTAAVNTAAVNNTAACKIKGRPALKAKIVFINTKTMDDSYTFYGREDCIEKTGIRKSNLSLYIKANSSEDKSNWKKFKYNGEWYWIIEEI